MNRAAGWRPGRWPGPRRWIRCGSPAPNRQPAPWVPACGPCTMPFRWKAAAFSWSVVDRLEGFEARIASGGSPADWGNGYSRFTVEQARKMLGTPPPIDKLVVCHGDACAPNTLLDGDGNFAGHVDLGDNRGGRPLGGPCRRRLEHRMELRPRLRTPGLRGLRHPARRGTHRLLPHALGPDVATRGPGIPLCRQPGANAPQR